MKEFLEDVSRQEGAEWQYTIDGDSMDGMGWATVHVFSDGVNAIAFVNCQSSDFIEGAPVDWDGEHPVDSAIAAALEMGVVPSAIPLRWPYTPSRAESEIAREFYCEAVERELGGAG